MNTFIINYLLLIYFIYLFIITINYLLLMISTSSNTTRDP